MSRRYELVDAYMALEGKESLAAIASVLLEGEATQPFLEALARRLLPKLDGNHAEFQLALVRRDNQQPVNPKKRAIAFSREIWVCEQLLNAQMNDASIEAAVTDIAAKLKKSRSWVYEIWSRRGTSPEKI